MMAICSIVKREYDEFIGSIFKEVKKAFFVWVRLCGPVF